MEIPDSERPETRSNIMGEEEGQQPSDSRLEAAEPGQEVQSQHQAGSVQGVEKKPQEIESVDSSRTGISSSNRNVSTDLSKVAVTGSSNTDTVGDAGPSSPKVGTSPEEVGIRIDRNEDFSVRLNETTGVGGGAGSVENANEGVPPRQQQEATDPSLPEGTAATTAQSGATPVVEVRSAGSFIFPTRLPQSDKSSDAHLIDIPPLRTSSKVEELDSYKRFGVARTYSNFSRTSAESAMGDRCRICQEHTEEPLMELGCYCRGELAKAHRTCIDHWFGNKGTNKCEVCQHVATNVPPPSSQPIPHFWVWRVGGPYNANPRRVGGVGPFRFNPLPMRPVLLMTLRRHPTILLLWLLLFAFMAYLFVDVTDSTSIGYAAMPIGFLFGVLVVLGLGTAARLVLECWHERAIRRNIRRMEEEPNLEDFPPDRNDIEIQTQPAEAQAASSVPSEGTAVNSPPEASVTASVAATAAPDEVNR